MDQPEYRAGAAEPPQPPLRGFWSLIVTQFQGAFNDNAIKIVVTFVGLNMALAPAMHNALVPLTAGLFSLPFILFSMAGGFLADRFSKRTVTIGLKLLEILIMAFALGGLWLGSLPMGLAAIFLMGAQSAFFGPSKYGLLPELLPQRRLSWGNGILELGTFLAIITGMAAGGLLYSQFKGQQVWSAAVLIGFSVLGLACSFGITRLPAANPRKVFRANFLGDLCQQVKAMRRDKVLWLACLGNTYFWFIGQLLQQGVIDYGANVLELGEMRTTYLLTGLAIGIGVGSFAAGYLSGGKIEYGLVPLGSVGITVFAAVLWHPELSFGQILATVTALGFFGGFFIVPIAAILQHRPAKGEKGAMLAAANLLSSAGLFVAAGVYWVLAVGLQLGPRGVFVMGALMTLAATVYLVWLLPDALLRFVLWLLTQTVYRIQVNGRENIPGKGGALFVCNHLSLVDALLLLASTDRHVRFIMFKGIYEQPWVKPFARILRAIPISSELRPREMLQSLRTASEAIQAGEVVCIFAEGQITRIGHLLPFRRGFERIMKDVEAPIIPVALDGVWGSIFSFERGRFLWKLPRRIPYRVTVCFGQALPHTATPFEVRERVQELMAVAWERRKAHLKPLHRAFVRTARHHPFRTAMADAASPRLSFVAVLVRTIFLARRLRKVWAGQQMVGLLLPPSAPGALANFAALLMGKVPVNLNYTVSEETLGSCIKQCGIKTVLTSRAFLEKVKLKVPGETLLLEELVSRRPGQKLAALFMAWLLPVGWLERALGRKKRASLDDLATVIFSSGSTGEPKGVMLSHYNIGSNIEQLEQVFGLNRTDGFVGVLPFFHSFGFTGTLWLPAVLGVRVAYHPNPLDAKAIGPLVKDHALTFLLATPTFLQLYLRSCAAGDFGSLRVVMTGAEKLPERLAAAFEEQFGIRPLEGYGCTECGPAVAVNTHDFRSAGFRQVGAKRGKIGHPLPGVSVCIVEPETSTRLPVGQPGLMLVQGPNVMQGYLGLPAKTAEVLRDGWYVTGDIAAIDEDGFLQITDRLSRFSKIGGEMVPHIKIEEKLHELAGVTEQTFIVTGVPDEKKGERLIVLHKLSPEQLQPCLEKLAQCDLPNLWKPRPDQFFHLDALPYLGTGKVDLRKARDFAAARSTGPSSA
ncbi:MAG TPA: acyl-[ACP]--phospholipid O-acyltransferase [Candidatus Paceibacterota bacterium]|nr:acyl-[ACP]--phospholipid O-acyltransferase [Verrucomicrobiota bacterium]HSA12408.1 acyl-[ACP]--phospholipid O-acyltransferase [Candidatus Paceibacterota bacterium]